ncbi:hypothetical protein ACE1SV_66600 [Streptomyces sennicomposti]
MALTPEDQRSTEELLRAMRGVETERRTAWHRHARVRPLFPPPPLRCRCACSRRPAPPARRLAGAGRCRPPTGRRHGVAGRGRGRPERRDPQGFVEHLGALTNLDSTLANYDLGQFQKLAETAAAA